MRVGFTGTREGMTAPQRATLRKLLLEFEGGEFHHGDCVGADAEAHDIAVEIGYDIVIHPPLRDKLRAHKSGCEIREPKAYLDRNRDIADETDVVVATPSTFQEALHSGTWSTVRHARKTNKPVVIIFPNGSTL